MLRNLGHQKRLRFRTVLMDTWYTTCPVMRQIETTGKIYCPIKKNRRVNETGGAEPLQRVDQLVWSPEAEPTAKTVHLRSFPAGHHVELSRLMISISSRTASSPTISIKTLRPPHKRHVLSDGRSSSFTVKSSRSPIWSAVSTDQRAVSVITSAVQCSFGYGCGKFPSRQPRLSARSSSDSSPSTLPGS